LGCERLQEMNGTLGKSTTSKYFAFDLIALTARSVSCFLTTAAPAQHP
jgi:hypothetical protein